MTRIFRGTLYSILIVGTADAATLGMRWRGVAGSTLALAPMQTADIEFYMDLLPGEVVTGLGVRQHIVPVTQIATTPAIAGWGDVSSPGSLGINPQWVAWFSPTPATNIAGPGEFIIGYQTVRLDEFGDGSDLDIRFGHQFTTVLDANLNFYDNWDARYNTIYSGYIAYGDWGNPGWDSKTGGGQPIPNPLILQRVPEPSTLAALGLAAVAAVMSRKRLFPV